MSENPKGGEPELVELIRSIDVRAPQELHDRVQAMVDARASRASGSRWSAWAGSHPAWGLGAAASALAVVAVALVLVLGGGTGGGGLNLDRASALTVRPATLPAPAENPSHHEQLAMAVDGIPFPYWGERFGWRPAGARVDRIGGRTITTVFYENEQGRRLGYSIVAGTPAPALAAGNARWRGGTAFHLTSVNGVEVITWVRAGHLCVMSGRGVDGATLLALASWHEHAAAS